MRIIDFILLRIVYSSYWQPTIYNSDLNLGSVYQIQDYFKLNHSEKYFDIVKRDFYFFFFF